MIDTVYLDMDGVIADFDYGYRSLFGVNCREDNVEQHWYDFVENDGFYKLHPTKSFTPLVSALFELDVNIIILTCVSERSDYKKVTSQKKRWLHEYNLGHLPAIFTRTKIGKSDYSSPNSLLIDDSPGCVNPFREKGGYAILHTVWKDTLKQIDCLKEKKLLSEIYHVLF
jgi:hypothetical protein